MDNTLTPNPTNLLNQSQQVQSFPPNQTQMPQTPVSTQQPLNQPQQQPLAQMPGANNPKKSHIVRTLIIMIILAIVVILLVLVFTANINNQLSNTSTITPTSVPIPPPPTTEEELNSIDPGSVEEDLKEIDTDLKTL